MKLLNTDIITDTLAAFQIGVTFSSLTGFMFFWAWVFVIATTLTAIFKTERNESDDDHPEGVLDTYKMLWKIVKLPAVFRYCVMLLTAKVV